jgi:hypothetical protein
MSRPLWMLSFLLAFAPLSAAAPTGGGFAAGDLWMNAAQMPGQPNGGLVRIDALTGQAQLVLPYTKSLGINDLAGAICYDPVRDRILAMAWVDNAVQALYAIDAAGNHVKILQSPVNIAALAPAADGKVYVSHFPGGGTCLLGYLDAANAYHPFFGADNATCYTPFAPTSSTSVPWSSLIYDAPSHSLLYAVYSGGLDCKGFVGGNGKGSVFKIALSPDGTHALSTSCEVFDIDGTWPFGFGGTPCGLSRGPDGNYLLTLHGLGATGSNDELAPRMQLVAPSPLSIGAFASNGPYTGAAWSDAGAYSSLRHQMVIFDPYANRLRAYDSGESGLGTVLADGLVGGSIQQERAGLIEIGPFAASQGQLAGTPSQVSIATGGSQALAIDFGIAFANKAYFVLGSASGFHPGFALKGQHIPLNNDGYTLLTLQNPNSFLLTSSYGMLDASGTAQAHFNLPPGAPASLAGLVLHHAAVALDGNAIVGVTNAAPLTLVP